MHFIPPLLAVLFFLSPFVHRLSLILYSLPLSFHQMFHSFSFLSLVCLSFLLQCVFFNASVHRKLFFISFRLSPFLNLSVFISSFPHFSLPNSRTSLLNSGMPACGKDKPTLHDSLSMFGTECHFGHGILCSKREGGLCRDVRLSSLVEMNVEEKLV